MKVAFMAHPVSGDVQGNLKKARAWMQWIEENYLGVSVCADWIIKLEGREDDGSEDRYWGISRNLAVIERCDEIWLVGPRISPGMQQELEHARRFGLAEVDHTSHGLDWPPGFEP